MVVWPILSALIQIFLLLIPGIISRKVNLVTDEGNRAVNSIVVNITWPLLIIDAMQIDFSMQILKDCGYMLIICLIIFAILFAVSFPFGKLVKLSRSKQFLAVFMMIFGSTAFVGFPVVKALYGMEALFYAAVIELITNVLILTVGIFMIQLSAGASLKVDVKQFFSAGMVGMIIGFILFVLEIRLPEVVGGAVEMVGAATTPLIMFVIGYQLGGLKLKEILGEMQVYAVCFMKLLVVPVVALLVVRLISGEEFSLLEKVLIVIFATPVSTLAPVLSQQYDGESAFATKGVLLSIVLSLITIPIFAIIMEL